MSLELEDKKSYVLEKLREKVENEWDGKEIPFRFVIGQKDFRMAAYFSGFRLDRDLYETEPLAEILIQLQVETHGEFRLISAMPEKGINKYDRSDADGALKIIQEKFSVTQEIKFDDESSSKSNYDHLPMGARPQQDPRTSEYEYLFWKVEYHPKDKNAPIEIIDNDSKDHYVFILDDYGILHHQPMNDKRISVKLSKKAEALIRALCGRSYQYTLAASLEESVGTSKEYIRNMVRELKRKIHNEFYDVSGDDFIETNEIQGGYKIGNKIKIKFRNLD